MAQDDPFAAFVAQDDDPFAAFAEPDEKPASPAKPKYTGLIKDSAMWDERPSLREMGSRATTMLPMLGATAATAGLAPAGAGLLAGIGRLITAGVGAAAGEGARQAIKGEDINLPAMATQGAVQGALPQAVGEVGPALKNAGVRLMQSALKPTDALVKSRAGVGIRSKSDVAKAVLDEGRSVSRGGLEKAQTALDATDDAAQAALQAGAGRGVTVDPFKVTAAIDRTGGQFGKQINAAPDVQAVQQVRDAFASNPHVSDPIGGMAPMPASLAHEFATTTGRNLKGKFGRLGGATVEAEKAGREAITSQLRQQIPELETLWAQEARQITARDALDSAVGRTANRDPIGLGGIVGAVKSPGLALTAMADRSALLKSWLARMLYNTSAPSATTTRAALVSLLGGNSEKE